MDTNTTERFGSDGKPKKNKENRKAGRGAFGWIILIILLLIVSSGIVICHEDEYKLVRRFGRVERTISSSGLYFKIPLIESVDTVPREILLYDLPASDVITSDKKTMIVDSYVLWRVTDPLKFAQTLSYSVSNAENRIDALVYNATKNTISNMTQDEVIRSRDGKMTIDLHRIAATDLTIKFFCRADRKRSLSASRRTTDHGDRFIACLFKFLHHVRIHKNHHYNANSNSRS